MNSPTRMKSGSLSVPMQQARAGSGQRHSVCGALEQREIELLFERLELRAERGLAQVQLFRGPGELACFSDGDKTAQLVKLHRLSPFHDLGILFYVKLLRRIKWLP